MTKLFGGNPPGPPSRTSGGSRSRETGLHPALVGNHVGGATGVPEYASLVRHVIPCRPPEGVTHSLTYQMSAGVLHSSGIRGP